MQRVPGLVSHQLDRRSADEHDVIKQVAERLGRDLKQLDVHPETSSAVG
jgi:hypothetical protein